MHLVTTLGIPVLLAAHSISEISVMPRLLPRQEEDDVAFIYKTSTTRKDASS